MFKIIPYSNEKYAVNENGDVVNIKTNRRISGDINNYGYHRVCLIINGKRKRYFRHRLVAMLFIDNPYNYPEVNHKDGNKANNNVSNLEWCDRIHNEREAHRLGIKLYKPFFIKMDGKVFYFEFVSQLASQLHVTKRCVQNWLKNKSLGYKKHNIEQISYIKA